MGEKAPFLYQPERYSFQSSYDPKAVTRASNTPKAPRPKQEGPLVTFNRHPDSYYTIYSRSNSNQMHPSTRKRITIVRIIQLVLRCFELIGALGILALLIMVKGMNSATGWILRIPPAVAIAHTIYSIYHLSRKASGRTPGSTASYMIFASACDISVIPFYVFNSMLSVGQYQLSLKGTGQDGEWSTILPQGQTLVLPFSKSLFLASVISGGLHLISLGVGIWLAVKFHKITNLPPDMNPLEDNLTSRHKRNKSSVSTAASTVSADEKRLSEPLESKRRSGTPYEDLSRPPTIPFLQTRQSTESFSTYKSTPPPSRGSDLGSRQYQVDFKNHSPSPRSSYAESKRSSGYSMSPSKRGSYQGLPTSENGADGNGQSPTKPRMKEAWFVDDTKPQQARPYAPASRNLMDGSPKRGSYQPIHQRYNSVDGDLSHPDPLRGNPPQGSTSPSRRPKSYAALSEISSNSRASLDIAGNSRNVEDSVSFKVRRYEDVTSRTPPLLVGQNRQVSSGNDVTTSRSGKRVVSGKIAEEGRAGTNGWGTRFRKVSGL